MRHTDAKTFLGSAGLLLAAALVVTVGQLPLRGQAADPPAEIAGLEKPARLLEGRITKDVRLTSDYDWIVRGTVVVAPPARLVIDEGTRVVAEVATRGVLVIDRGAEIQGHGSLEVAVVWSGTVTGRQARAGSDAPPTPLVGVAATTTAGQRTETVGAGSVAATEGASGESPRAPAVRSTRRVAGLQTSQVIGPPADVPNIDKPVRVIHGRFTSDVVLTNDTYWVLRGAVFIGEPGRIIIDPGTRVIGELATRGTLVIERGAQIIADGTAEEPIVFTSDQPIGQRGRGDWGGLVINGRAPVNLPGGVGIGEGDTGVYGGDDPDDSSGILRFVRVEFAGIEFSPDNELNGIAFQGVGRGTIVDSVQVKFNKDDGIEMFGGTVDIKRAVLTGIGDDSIDWTFGWQGRLQFAVVQQRGDDADRGIEADNNGDNNDLLPRSKPTIYNLTLIGDPSAALGPESTHGMNLRAGTAGVIRNFIVTGFKGNGLRIDQNSTLTQVQTGELSARHGIVFGNGSNLPAGVATLVAAAGGTIDQVDPGLIAPFDLLNPNFRPAAGAPALVMSVEDPPDDGFFEPAPYRGALGGDPEEDWTIGWTDYSQN